MARTPRLGGTTAMGAATVTGLQDIGASNFDRDLPLRQAQEMLPEQRPLMPPRPAPEIYEGNRYHDDIAVPRGASATPASARVSPTGAAAAAISAARSGGDVSANSKRWPSTHLQNRFSGHAATISANAPRGRRRPASERRGAISSARASAEQRMRVAQKQEEENLQFGVDHRRRNVILNEIRYTQGRWPREARWAGQPPEFIKDRFDRFGTLANERGDGRTLPHERGEKWWWPGA
eukprot:TRINITY_DN64241_c0_g1_i1.p1 TRINITY_DN64241_c0_g1~~TRINITY_DN64241_c0_g1_i1.p1  ORF type:complete len:236 (+),score=20.46 TRINITY_DN64241_c0_g1_i1:80-787(+)